MFTHVAIDWGEKRMGLAFGDSKTALTVAYSKLISTESFFSLFAKEKKEKKFHTVLLGYPTNFKLEPTETTEKVKFFKLELEKLFSDLKIVYVNERNSTQVCLPFLRNSFKKQRDNLAALNILDTYFKQKNIC